MFRFRINHRLVMYLMVGILVLAIINALDTILGRPFWTITKIFYLGFDNNFSAWYSSILLFITGLLAYSLAEEMGRKEMYLLAILLFFMSADEVSQFHETAGHLISKYLGFNKTSLVKYCAHSGWVWFLGPIVIVLFLYISLLLKRLYSGDKRAFFFLLLGFGTIVVGGVFLEAMINFLNRDGMQWLWDIEVIAEESLEMLGTLAIMYSLSLLGESYKLKKNRE